MKKQLNIIYAMHRSRIFFPRGGGVGVQAIIVFAKGSEAIFSSFTTMWIQRKTLPPLICTCTWMYTLMPYTITIKPCMPTIYGSNNFCVKGALQRYRFYVLIYQKYTVTQLANYTVITKFLKRTWNLMAECLDNTTGNWLLWNQVEKNDQYQLSICWYHRILKNIDIN